MRAIVWSILISGFVAIYIPYVSQAANFSDPVGSAVGFTHMIINAVMEIYGFDVLSARVDEFGQHEFVVFDKDNQAKCRLRGDAKIALEQGSVKASRRAYRVRIKLVGLDKSLTFWISQKLQIDERSRTVRSHITATMLRDKNIPLEGILAVNMWTGITKGSINIGDFSELPSHLKVGHSVETETWIDVGCGQRRFRTHVVSKYLREDADTILLKRTYYTVDAREFVFIKRIEAWRVPTSVDDTAKLIDAEFAITLVGLNKENGNISLFTDRYRLHDYKTTVSLNGEKQTIRSIVEFSHVLDQAVPDTKRTLIEETVTNLNNNQLALAFSVYEVKEEEDTATVYRRWEGSLDPPEPQPLPPPSQSNPQEGSKSSNPPEPQPLPPPPQAQHWDVDWGKLFQDFSKGMDFLLKVGKWVQFFRGKDLPVEFVGFERLVCNAMPDLCAPMLPLSESVECSRSNDDIKKLRTVYKATFRGNSPVVSKSVVHIVTVKQTLRDQPGFNEYRWYNEDFSWVHNVPFSHAMHLVGPTVLSIKAWDVDSDAPVDPEQDQIFIDNHYVGYLKGANKTWSTTEIEIPEDIVTEAFRDGNAEIFIDIDSGHQTYHWAVAIAESTLMYHYKETETSYIEIKF
ncbi:MAG: hypothetical protein DRG83_15330 [Deltaproteobacteria bacterium]|nr:MAG: hypothetical protein DRG83_15330 [Deltaproteobacteria bacterium]